MAASKTLLFDLDGTLVDSVYQHVLAWNEALREAGIELSVWRIHRKIGMSGGLFTQALLRETGRDLTQQQVNDLKELHTQYFQQRAHMVAALPGAQDLLATLTRLGVRWAIATSGQSVSAAPSLNLLDLPDDVPVVTRDQVSYAKPNPDLFEEAARRLDIDPTDAVVVGDSVWDLLAARQARMLGVGLLSGGYGRNELELADAYRVYEDPAELLRHLDEVGIRATPG